MCWPLELIVRREGASALDLPASLLQIEVPETLMEFLSTLSSAPEYLAVVIHAAVTAPELDIVTGKQIGRAHV